MHIGLDISPVSAFPTGIGVYTKELLTNLVRLEPEWRWHGLSYGRSSVDLTGLPETLEHRHVPIPARILIASWHRLRLPAVEKVLPGIGLFHGVNYILPAARNVPLILSIHDLSFLRVPQYCDSSVSSPYAKALPDAARRAACVLTCSESSKRDIVELLNVPEKRVRVTPYAATDKFQPIPEAEARDRIQKAFGFDGPFFLSVGSLEPRKNLKGVFEAFARLNDTVEERLVVTGVGDAYLPALENLAHACGVAERVSWVGYVDTHQLAALYSVATALAYPSHYEGFGIPVLEAMRCGCPVITGNNSSLPEVAGDAAVFVDATDVQGLADAMENVAGDTATRESLRERGLKQSARFKWARTAEMTRDVYREFAG